MGHNDPLAAKRDQKQKMSKIPIFWELLGIFRYTMAPPWHIIGAIELVNTVNNLVITSEHNTWVIMAPWRPGEVKNSENEQKMTILDQNPLLFGVI